MSGFPPQGSGFFDIRNAIIDGRGLRLSGFGRRLGISTATDGDDIWTGVATTLPIPPDTGEQMSLVSTSASDAAAGTGLRTIEINYLDNNGNPQSEIVTMNGLVQVNTIATNIRFIQEIHALTAGTNLLAVGTITIFSTATPANIYNQIIPGTNISLNTARMVPVNKKLFLLDFNCSSGVATGNRFAEVRIRSTDHNGTLLPRLFHFKDVAMLFNSVSNHEFALPEGSDVVAKTAIPAFSIVKCTSYTDQAGANVAASWEGILLDA